MSASLLLFTKIPGLAPCKTRLLDSCGVPEASIRELALAFLKDSFAQANNTSSELFIFSSPLTSAKELSSLLQIDCDFSKFKYYEQSGQTFAERLENATQAAFSICGAGLVILGSDCPTIGSEALELALKKVEQGNFVLGPSNSGGIYLIGIPKSALENGFSLKTVFDEIKSTELERFSEEIRKFKAPLHLLPFNIDIDVEDDLISLIAYLKTCGGEIAPYTLETIKKLGLKIVRNEADNRKLKIIG